MTGEFEPVGVGDLIVKQNKSVLVRCLGKNFKIQREVTILRSTDKTIASHMVAPYKHEFQFAHSKRRVEIFTRRC